MHFTFSDLIDNVSDKSIGARKGDKNNDKFLYTHFALTYDFGMKNKTEETIEEFENPEEEWLAADTSDYDKDGVVDFLDECIKTPKHAFPVDLKGCPIDMDEDLVPDYRDDEPNTIFGDLVNLKGVTQYDEDLERSFHTYFDSNFYTDERHISSSGDEGEERTTKREKRINLNYTVIIGTNSKKISANELHKYLSYKNFRTVERGDSVFYVLAGFNSVAEALGGQLQLELDGVTVEGIAVLKEESGEQVEVQKIYTPSQIFDLDIVPVFSEVQKKESLYRVQIGTFSKRISAKAFSDLEGVEEIKGEDGLYRYYSGIFTNKDEAAKYKIKTLSAGYVGAFITVFNDGNRIKLASGGYDVRKGFDDTVLELSKPTKGVLFNGSVQFRIQVGAYKNNIPIEVLDQFLELGTVLPIRDSKTGVTKYLVGKFKTYEEATKEKELIKEKGLLDAFLIGDFNGNLITIQEALELSK